MTLPRSGAAEWAGSQAAPWNTMNQALRTIDGFTTRAIVEDRDLSAPPGSCADGAIYLVAGSPTGDWSGKAGQLAIAKGANAASGWIFVVIANEGSQVYVRDENITIQHNGSSWVTVSVNGNPVESLIVGCSDESTAITAGTTKVTFRMPYAFSLTAVRASLSIAQAGGSIFTVDINEGGNSILSTKLTIDNGERTSVTAATPAVISDSALADDAEITVDVDAIGDGTAKGLKICLIGHRT